MILDGRDIADYIKQRHHEQVRKLHPAPVLAIVTAGSDPATQKYLAAKQRYGQDIGVRVDIVEIQSEGQVREIRADGIIVQLPLGDLDADKAISYIADRQDIDGLKPNSQFQPATVKAILWLLAAYQIDWKNKIVAVIGQGRLVGKPLTEALRGSGAQVLTADERTENLQGLCLQADIVVSATGQAGLIKPGMVKAGAVVVDCGSPEPEVDPVLLKDASLKITPVPGGVGPMTVACLYDNLLIAAAGRQT